MKHDILIAFSYILQKQTALFTADTLPALRTLQTDLATLTETQVEQAEEYMQTFYKQHLPIRDAVRKHRDYQRREITNMPMASPGEDKVGNITLLKQQVDNQIKSLVAATSKPSTNAPGKA